MSSIRKRDEKGRFIKEKTEKKFPFRITDQEKQLLLKRREQKIHIKGTSKNFCYACRGSKTPFIQIHENCFQEFIKNARPKKKSDYKPAFRDINKYVTWFENGQIGEQFFLDIIKDYIKFMND